MAFWRRLRRSAREAPLAKQLLPGAIAGLLALLGASQA